MLHSSNFTGESLCKWLRQEYNLKAETISVIPRGRACLFLAACGEGKRYVVKEYQRGYDSRWVKQEPRLCAFLKERGVPASEFILPKDGRAVHTYRGRLVTVQKYIEGEAPGLNSAAPRLMEASARLLGRLHEVLQAYPRMHEEFTHDWADPAKLPPKRREFEGLLAKAERLEDPRAERIAEDLRFKLEGLDWLAAQPNVTEGLTYVNTHGDCCVGQLLTRDNKIAAVVDFAGACRMPAVWEVIRSFSLGDPACAKGALPPERLEAYTRVYEEQFPLTDTDRRGMSRLYAAQLLRSTFGYRQYFDPLTEGREELLRFGFWRTEMLRTLMSGI